MNLDIIKKRIAELNNKKNAGGQNTDKLWKPTGKAQIRIVPYKFNKENPFIELFFHYGLGGKNYLSPISFGRPDPIVNFSQKVRMGAKGDKSAYALAKKLEPKMRTYVPVIVRGEEDKGVKFWAFGKTVYETLLNFCDNPDYGDISDPVNGFDILVEFKTAEEAGKNFPETKIMLKRQPSPMCEKEQLKMIMESQKNILDIFKEPTFEELEKVLQDYLNGNDESADVDSTPSTTAKPSQSENKSTPSTTKPESKLSKEDLDEEFNDLFNS
jgi:hypothetical protein